MREKKRIAVLAAMLSLAGAGFTVYKTSGAHPGSTGAPGDLTCAQAGCHTDAKIRADSGAVNTLLFSSPGATYTPGNSYTLTLQVQLPFVNKFGFELVALQDSANTNTGSFTTIDGVRTQIINHAATVNDLRYSMTHKTAGTMTTIPGAIEWTMRWTAPSYNAGTITFWYATNCSNNNGDATGDRIYLSKFQISPGATDSVATPIRTSPIPSPGMNVVQMPSGTLRVLLTGNIAQPARITVLDITGKAICEKDVALLAAESSEDLVLPAGHAKGTYIGRVQTGTQSVTKKIQLE